MRQAILPINEQIPFELILSIRADLDGLSIFSSLKKHPLLKAFEALLCAVSSVSRDAPAVKTAIDDEAPERENSLLLCRAWASFIGVFLRRAKNGSFFETVACLALTDDNPFTRAAEALKNHGIQADELRSPLLKAAAASDLDRLGRIAAFDISALGFCISLVLRNRGFIAAAQGIETEALTFRADTEDKVIANGIFPAGANWGESVQRFTSYIREQGAGALSLHHFFFWAPLLRTGSIKPATDIADINIRNNRSLLQPVRGADPVSLADLAAYESQRSVVIANTERFIKGKPANNLLLYGDRGTGKSATIKAVCNEYAKKGLRLLEVRKNDLFDLPRILDTLAARSLPFILFIDDLSFEVIDDSFTCLKALLEGGVEIRPPNVVIYATSNRRHLVKERLADRPGLYAAADVNGEVRAFETMQEQFSLADRFGLSLLFTAPSQEEYIQIAEHIACRRGLKPDSTFRENALRWEKWFNGRSPRTAAQFVDWFVGGADFPWD